MALRPYKFIVQAIPQVVDDAGEVVGEARSEPVELYGCDAVAKWAADFPAKLAEAETAA